MDGQIAILKRLAVFEQGAKGHAGAVTKLGDDLRQLLAKNALIQTQIDLMNAVVGKNRDANDKERQKMTREFSEAMQTVQGLEARIEQLNQSVALLVQDNAAINTKLAQQPVVIEAPARASTSLTLSSLNQTTIEQLDQPSNHVADHDHPAVDEETVVSPSPVHRAKVSDIPKTAQKPTTSTKSQKTSRVAKVTTKRAPASRTKKALAKKGAQPQLAAPAALARVGESNLGTSSNSNSKTREEDGEEEPPASETENHQPIAEKVKERAKSKETGALESHARPKKQNGQSAQTSDKIVGSAHNTKRGIKRKAEILLADQDLTGTKPRTTMSLRNDGKAEALLEDDAHSEQKEEETRDITKPAKAAPALRRSTRTRQSQAPLSPNRKSKPSTAVVKPPVKKLTSGRDPATGKFIKREPAKRLVRVSSEGSPTLIGEPEQSIETSKPTSRTHEKPVQNTRRKPAAKRLAPISPNSRPAHPVKWTAPQSRYLQREISPPTEDVSRRPANTAKPEVSKENLLPESLLPSSPPPLQSGRNPSEASTFIDRHDSAEILVEDSLPKLPPPAADVQRVTKRRRIDTNVDDDIEELMRLKRELMGL
jgi:hypothetical protein